MFEERMQEKKYKPLILPKLNWNRQYSSEIFGELVVHPLENGFGITLGNALRRAMLSSIEGAAVTSIIIKGVNNEFSTITGVFEDVLNIVLNIKEIVVKNKTGERGKMSLSFKGEGRAKVSDIKADEHLELVNKEHVLANVASNGHLEIEFFVENGRGYLPAQWPQTESLQEDGRIFTDAMFSPIKRVEYKVEKTRVGQSIDYDKLIISINTNGAMLPQEAIDYGISVLRTQLEHFLLAKEIPFNKISEHEKEKEDTSANIVGPTKGLPVGLFLKPIDELEFSVRAHNCLIGAGIKRVIDLVNLAEEDTLRIKNFGRKSLREVKEILSAFNLHLGMNVKEADLKKIVKQQESKE
jgi:DNA-directed RNA polymerase subunit alpha